MTICIAAICNRSAPCIIGATDRMVTAGDIEFEPETPNLYPLADRIVALVAGDADAQAEICTQVRTWRPDSPRAAVDTYCGCLAEYNRSQAERSILAPLGLNMQMLLSRQSQISPRIAEHLLSTVEREKVGIETIICGMDDTGPHIYTIDHTGRAYCNDGIGFAAIGGGVWHAQSEFMFARFTPNWTLPRALLLLYSAKERAEVAPGVGDETDMFFIANHCDQLQQRFIEVLRNTCLESRNAQRKATEDAHRQIEDHFEEIARERENSLHDAGPSQTSDATPKKSPKRRRKKS